MERCDVIQGRSDDERVSDERVSERRALKCSLIGSISLWRRVVSAHRGSVAQLVFDHLFGGLTLIAARDDHETIEFRLGFFGDGRM